MDFIDFDKLTAFLELACNHYEKTAPTVCSYLDDLYIRVNESMDDVMLSEIRFIQTLNENNLWMHPNHAANRTYHLMERLKLPTDGHIGF